MTLLERPLAQRPLPSRPLPERPLPERPLPGRPLPGAAPAAAHFAPNATLAQRLEVNPTLAVFTVELDAPLAAYRAGQYVAVGLPDGERLLQRPYSIVDVSADGRAIELFVRRVTSGALTTRLWQVAAGERVRVGPPKGLFVAHPADERRLYVGSGTGLAPLLAMIAEWVAGGQDRPAALIHGVSYMADHHYAPRIAGWVAAGAPIDYRPTVSRPDDPANEGWSGRVGRTEQQLAELLSEPGFRPAGLAAYLCGNAAMIDACTALLRDAGVEAGAIRTERF